MRFCRKSTTSSHCDNAAPLSDGTRWPTRIELRGWRTKPSSDDYLHQSSSISSGRILQTETELAEEFTQSLSQDCEMFCKACCAANPTNKECVPSIAPCLDVCRE